MMKYEITKEQILEMYEWGNSKDKANVREWWPEAFKPVLEVGKWYKRPHNKALICVTTEVKENGGYEFYGFDIGGRWVDCEGVKQTFIDKEVLATEREVTIALDKESKNRGFTDGVYFKDLVTGKLCRIKGNFRYMDNELSQLKHLSQTLFKDGVWAEIIPTMTKSEAEQKLNCKIV